MINREKLIRWERCEGLFRQADASLPEDRRFKAWKQSQTDAFNRFQTLKLRRMFLFFPTGEGKSKTSLALIGAEGYDRSVVIAPLKTHDQWKRDAGTLGIQIKIYTHEMFRQPGTHTPTNVPWIVDEYHKLGGHGGEGFKKWKRLAPKIKHPIVGASATPNYNDPDRAFCLEVAFDERPIYNYGDWIHKHCLTEPNRYAYYPKVLGFKDYDNVQAYLSDKPWVAYIEDKATWEEWELILPSTHDFLFEEYGLVVRNKRITNSDMEKRHKRIDSYFIDDDGRIRQEIMDTVIQYIFDSTDHKKWLIFCSHKTVAEALYKTMMLMYREVYLISGDTKDVERQKMGFINTPPEVKAVLIGTSAIAEGVDGLDKVCQALLLLDPLVGDGAKTRQIIGRILPRGTDDGLTRDVVTAMFR